eukprot:2462462-Prorocentrum_lima.AAC.1
MAMGLVMVWGGDVLNFGFVLGRFGGGHGLFLGWSWYGTGSSWTAVNFGWVISCSWGVGLGSSW